MQHWPRPPFFSKCRGVPLVKYVDKVLCLLIPLHFLATSCFMAMLQIHSGLDILSTIYYFLQGTALQWISSNFADVLFLQLRFHE